MKLDTSGGRALQPPHHLVHPSHRHRGFIAAGLSLAFALLAALAPSASAQRRAIPAGYSSETLQVKLTEGSNPSAIQRAIPQEVRRSAVHIRPLFAVPVEDLARLKSEGERRSGKRLKDLRLWFEIRLGPGADAEEILRVLRATPGIETAEPAPLPAPPPSGPSDPRVGPAAQSPADTPSYVASQGYLGEATGGIDAEFAWTIPGGTGAGRTIYDIEYSWNQSHEDLGKASGLAILVPAGHTQRDPFDDDNHGTAVLGELIADDDGKGVTGIAHGADLGLAAAATFDEDDNPHYVLGTAIALAAADGSPGDVILIEQQTCVCDVDCSDPDTQLGFGPSEWDEPVFDATETATANGFIVVAAAGNGSVDLDMDSCNDMFDRGTRDSGAIIVGQGHPPGDLDRQRRPGSSYGSRVDLQGWGSSVMTTGYGAEDYVDPDDPTNPDKWYTPGFSGTSSASPMIAASVAILQGVATAHALPLFTADGVRDVLVNWGSPQQGNTAEHIGPRPNLKASIASMINIAPTADAGPDQTVECASHTGSTVQLDGFGTEDPNVGQTLSFTWRENGIVIETGIDPWVDLALGVHVIELTVEDDDGASDTDEVVITIQDTTDPVITLLGDNPLVLECAVDAYIEPGATVTDICDADPSLVIDASGVNVNVAGLYGVDYTAEDASGNDAWEGRTVQVVDTTPPHLAVNSDPLSLWPPTHKYATLELTSLDIEASDLCDPTVFPNDVVVASAESDEAEEVPEPGDGETWDDIVIAETCRSIDLRVERMRAGNGRVYSLELAVADASDNVSAVGYQVHVPEQIKLGPLAVLDIPALYEVEGCDPVTGLAGKEVEYAAEALESAEAEAAGDYADIPVGFELDQNYPNPFAVGTRIRFGIPDNATVRLEVVDLLGRRVAVLADGAYPAGYHTVDWYAGGAANGIYLVKLTSGPVTEIRHLTLQR
jgi:hypothetical protein